MRRILGWILIAGGGFLTYEGASFYFDEQDGQDEARIEWQAGEHGKNRPAEQSAEPVLPSGVAYRMRIPRLDSELFVLPDAEEDTLRRGPGHMTETPLPGPSGNAAIAGHRDTHFRILKDIQVGDDILIDRGRHHYRYRVTATKIVRPTEVSVLRQGADPELTLITCYPFYWMGHAPKRFIVKARQVEEDGVKRAEVLTAGE